MKPQPESNYGRLAGAFLALAMFATVLVPVLVAGQVGAQSQNEILTTVLYDGTQFDFDPLDNGTGDGVHTPGLDADAQNNVVKTHDTFAVRVDWNINEADATNVFVTVVLPPFASWAPDQTGMFAGCDIATSSFTDAQTLVCSLLDQPEGSNGAFRPIAQLNEAIDGDPFDVVSTLTTDDDAAGVSDGLDDPLVVSEAPIANWLKELPEVSGPVVDGSGDGYVFLYPLSLIDFSQGASPILGAGSIASTPINFFDHAYGLPTSATIATPAQLSAAGFAGRTACGAYDGTGAFPVTVGTWTCGAAATASTGYPVVPVSVSGFATNPAPALNADGTPNVRGAGVNVLTGQIAFWLPAVDVDAAIAAPGNPSVGSALFENGIGQQDESVPVSSQDDLLPIQIPGNGGPVDESAVQSPDGEDPADNVAQAILGDSPGGGEPGATIGHDIRFYPGPLAILESFGFDGGTEAPRHSVDIRTLAQGGPFFLPGSNNVHADSGVGDRIGETPRGATVTINSQVLTAGSPGTLFDAPISGCTAFDTTHYNISAFGSIPVTQTDTTPRGNAVTVAGGYSITSNAGPLAHVYTGAASSFWPAFRGQHNAVGGIKQGLPFTVEFTNAPLELVGTSFGVLDDELTCNDSDAGSAGWVDATDVAGLAAFDTLTPGDGIYEGITRARVRITDRFAWEALLAVDNQFTGFQAFFQATVKADLAVQTVDQELFALQSHAFGEVGADGASDFVPFIGSAPLNSCQPYNAAQWEANGNARATPTGWCNNTFIDDGANSLDTSDLVDFDNRSTQRTTLNAANIVLEQNASGTVIHIVEAQLGLSKTNDDGLGDIKDNGDLVEFTIEPRVIGSNLEALTNVRLSDALPANYTFVQFLSQPATGTGCTEVGDVITCQFSEPNPAVDSDPALPTALAGGWSDSFTIQVEVVGAIANPNAPVVITNTATLRSTGLGPWDPNTGEFVGDIEIGAKVVNNSANSFLPLPADEGAIVKAVDTLAGPCEVLPADGSITDLVAWQDQCSQIPINGNPTFVLSLENEGNTAFSNIEIIDVFPWNGDVIEPPSGTNVFNPSGSPTPATPTSSVSTVGDGRTPPSSFAGTLGFIGVTPLANANGADVWVTADPPGTVSRDPLDSFTNGGNTWCQVSAGGCPTGTAVTATYTQIPGPLNPGDILELELALDTENHSCEDIWTNTFGARVDQILLPIRSNDVSVMVEQCPVPEIDIEKSTNGVDSDVAPGEDIVAGSAVTWTYVVENSGDTALLDATVTDSQGVVVDCDIDGDGAWDGTNVIPFMLPGDFVTCEGTGVATPGPYTNTANVSGDPVIPDFSDPSIDQDDPSTWPTDPADYATLPPDSDGNPIGPVEAEDDSHYTGTILEGGIDIEKDTNGVDSDVAPGEDIAAGSLVTWTYVVTNTGATGLANATVTDTPAPVGGISCDVDGDGALDGTNVIPFLAVGGAVTCEATGVATPGPFTNNASVGGDPVVPDFAACDCDPSDPTTWPTDPADYFAAVGADGEPQGPVDDEDPSNYTGTVLLGGIDIEKDTNGVQSDTAPGELIPAGAPVTWTYVVTNTGGTALANATVTDNQGVVVNCDVDGDGALDGANVIAFLAPGASVTCEGTGLAVDGPYENIGDVSGDPIVPDFATCGCDPSDPTTWPTDAADYVAAVGADGEPQAPVDDADASNYTGLVPGAAIDIEKDTNGVQSDVAPGETINVGEAVTWTYVVVNTGSVALTDATVTDSQGVTVDCDVDGDGAFDGTNVIPLLAPGASVTCEGTGVAIDGPYENVADVSGAPALPDFSSCGCDPDDPTTWPTDAADYSAALGEDGTPLAAVSDADASNYTGFTPVYDLALEKTLADGQATTGLAIGDDVTFTIEIFNQGNVDATDVGVIDYVPTGLELNDPAWTDNGDGTASNTIAAIAAGTSAIVDITLTITAAGDLNNVAEITGSSPVDANGDPFLDPAGAPLVDIDSIADADNSDVLSDGVLNGAAGDEDDHDIAAITIAAPAAESAPVLAFTGQNSLITGAFALLIVLAGAVFVALSRRDDEEETLLD